jgi:hypothetical protein
MNLKGKIKVIGTIEAFDSGFTKRELVITTEEQYPQDVKFDTVKDKTRLLDNMDIGDSVDVHFNIRGNEYNGKYYVNLQAWKIESIITNDDEEDDFPF